MLIHQSYTLYFDLENYLEIMADPNTMWAVHSLMEVGRDTLWIREALNDIPAYLERIIQHVAAKIEP